MIRAGLVIGLVGLSLVALGCERSETAGERARQTGSGAPATASPPTAHPDVPGRTEPCPGGPGGLNAAGHPCEPPSAKGAK
jgi:hypothetical protein